MNLLCSEAENMSVSTNYYEFIKLIYENVSKYIKKYKEETSEYFKKISKIQERYTTRLSGEEILKKIKNIDTEHIIYLSQLIFNIVKVQLTYLNIFIKEVDEIIKSFDKTLKEKNTMSSGYLNEYEDCKNNLQKKYKDIEKAKYLFFDNANITENLLINFYTPKIPNCKNPEIPIVTKSQIENSTKITKKNENDYSNLVKSAKACEDKFFSLTSNSIDNMTRISCDLTTKMKDNIVSLLLNLKNCFKLPLGEIDTYLPELVNLDENKKIEEIIKSSYKKDDKLIRVQLEKYEIKSIPKYDEDNKDEKFKYIIEDNEIINTINYMENNFNLIVKGSLSEINSPKKLRCRLLTYKLLSFSKKVQVEIKDLEKSEKVNNNKSNDDDKKNYSITDEEVKELYELLEKPENRTIFLKKLNNFRKFGDLEFPTREYYILGNVFNIISRNIKKDKNLENQLALVILSETYYKIEDNEKVYILKTIKNNKIFHDIEFWNDFINKSILKEVDKNLRNDLKNNIEDVKKKRNFEQLVFAQMFPIIKTMIEFDLEDDILNKLIENLVAYYRLDETSKKILLDMINSKGIENKEKIKEKSDKYLNMSCIQEDESEIRDTVFENLIKINTIKVKRDKEKEKKIEEDKKEENKEEKNEENIIEDEEDEDNKINKQMIIEDKDEEDENEDDEDNK